jgi:serine/threonine-protein phosphatase 2A regulatory subunit B'
MTRRPVPILTLAHCRANVQNLSRTKSDSKSKSQSPQPPPKPSITTSGSTPGPSSPAAASPIDRTSGGSPLNQNSNATLGSSPSPGNGGLGAPLAPRRSPVADKTSPAPPLVVISGAPNAAPVNSEMPTDPIPHSPHTRGFASPERSLGPDGQPTPPRAGPLQRLRGGPKDTIPIVGKAPRKQRSSRFYVSDKVEIEKLPAFTGESCNA